MVVSTPTPAVSPPAATPLPTANFEDQEKSVEPARHYVCRSCSTAVPAGHKFCGRCGTPVPAEIRELKTNFFGDMQNPTKAKLILIRGEGMDGLSFHLKAEQHIVGREGQLIFPDDPFVSPKHANFFYREGSLVVRDEGSLNGVYIRIRGTVPIEPNNTFLAGEQLFRLEKLDPVSDDGPDSDGTNFYASPRRDSAFRLCQVFRGNAIGMTVHALGTSMTVGRDGADLNFPEDLFMSAEHCRIDHSRAPTSRSPISTAATARTSASPASAPSSTATTSSSAASSSASSSTRISSRLLRLLRRRRARLGPCRPPRATGPGGFPTDPLRFGGARGRRWR